ncbi:MAG: NmrA family NAD(P)-binding protein [Dehalococcoidia bacterium]|nr:NmrA family NAD(P)-binding protein [Dehalococcoidia bacterium]
MLVAVTGASGHLGANLVRALIERKWRVRALIRNDTRAFEGLDIEFLNGDVLNEESLRKAFTGAKPPLMILPMWLAKASAPLAMEFDRLRGTCPLFTPISLKELASNPFLSHDKASRELGYQPRPLEQTIADTVGWFASHGFLH